MDRRRQVSVVPPRFATRPTARTFCEKVYRRIGRIGRVLERRPVMRVMPMPGGGPAAGSRSWRFRMARNECLPTFPVPHWMTRSKSISSRSSVLPGSSERLPEALVYSSMYSLYYYDGATFVKRRHGRAARRSRGPLLVRSPLELGPMGPGRSSRNLDPHPTRASRRGRSARVGRPNRLLRARNRDHVRTSRQQRTDVLRIDGCSMGREPIYMG
jgi:hypothetical protein